MDREALQGALAYLQRGCRRAKTVEAVHQMHAGLQSRLGCQCVPNGTMDLVVEIPAVNKNLVKEGH